MRAVLTLLLAGCGPRVAVYTPNDDGFSYELPEEDGECDLDLDCTLNGCGNHCTSVDAESFAGACLYAGHNDYAECGCVRGRCRWYFHG